MRLICTIPVTTAGAITPYHPNRARISFPDKNEINISVDVIVSNQRQEFGELLGGHHLFE